MTCLLNEGQLLRWKSGGLRAVPEGPVHHLCWVTICLEDLLLVVPFFNQFGGMANILGSGPQAFDDVILAWW